MYIYARGILQKQFKNETVLKPSEKIFGLRNIKQILEPD